VEKGTRSCGSCRYTVDNQYILYILYIYSKEGKALDIILSNTIDQPIYEQIANQIKAQIISGTLEEGSLLPSIRNLAKDLRISVITTKRSYDELEREGYLLTVPGKGTYVALKNTEIIREAYLRRIEEHLKHIIRLSVYCNLDEEEICMMYRLLQEGDN